MTLATIKAAVLKYSKWVVTAVGVVLGVLSQVLPLVPVAEKHWVLGAITIGTLIVRDLTDLTSSSLFSSKAPVAPPAA
jgi:hypothetical protein